jgi:hypothetical protein
MILLVFFCFAVKGRFIILPTFRDVAFLVIC